MPQSTSQYNLCGKDQVRFLQTEAEETKPRNGKTKKGEERTAMLERAMNGWFDALTSHVFSYFVQE